MFGLKIRSWMENHIVRPRKKGNKNKNGNSGNLVTSINNTQNGHKGISSNQGDSTVGSPARRSEVSPIQNHTTSRVGWQSPQDDEFCPNIEQNYPYMVKSSTTSPKNMYRQTNSTTISAQPHEQQQQQQPQQQQYNNPQQQQPNLTCLNQYSKSVDAKYFSRTFEVHSANTAGNNHHHNPARDNSSALSLKSTSASAATAASNSSTIRTTAMASTAYTNSIAIGTRQQSNHHLGESNKMFEQQKTFNGSQYERIYNNKELNDDRNAYNCATSSYGPVMSNGIVASGGGSGRADDGDNQDVMVNQTTFQSNSASSSYSYSGNGTSIAKITKNDKSQHQQNYHHHHHHQHQYQYEEESQHQRYYVDRKQHEQHSGSNSYDSSNKSTTGSSMKSEQQTANIYQQNGFLIKQHQQQQQHSVAVNNNIQKQHQQHNNSSSSSINLKNNGHARDECQLDGDGYVIVPNDDIIIVGKSLNECRYGKILNNRLAADNNPNGSNITAKNASFYRNNVRPIPMLPSPPSTPPPPLLTTTINGYNEYHQTKSNTEQQQHHTNRFNSANTNKIQTIPSLIANVHAKHVDSSNTSNTNNNINIVNDCPNNNNNNNLTGNSISLYSNSCSARQQSNAQHSSGNNSSGNSSGGGDIVGSSYNHQYHQHQSLVNGQHQQQNCANNANAGGIERHSTANNGLRSTAPVVGQTHSNHQQQYHHHRQHKSRYVAGCSHLTPAPGNHQLAHVINSLSSPESAYSTGYSTDGTSPGTTNAPEYYINMRTGTHYFPRGVNGVAAVERSRQKFGLNKIDETAGESMSVLATGANATSVISNHRRTESCDLSHRRQCITVLSKGSSVDGIGEGNGGVMTTKEMCCLMSSTHSRMSPDLQRHMAYQSYKGFESPSPRQRCRIRTNPWFSTADATNASVNGNSAMKKMDIDTSSTSSGVKSSSDAGTDDKPCKNHISSESENSSSTEIEVSRKSFSPNTIRKRKLDKQLSERLSNRVSGAAAGESDDEDATFNELMGKFDESYIYEKETDILSDDSDPTECISDLDTGQDGGDECDTDELLDIDYIDTGSTLEIVDKDDYKNTGSCTYHHNQVPADAKRQSKLRKSRKQQCEENGGSRRRKRLTRTRKRNSECRDGSQTSNKTTSPNRFRESRSVGGTPVSLRRNKPDNRNNSTPKMVPLSSRCNSLTFTEIHSIRSRFLAIAESEKALLKADIEADVKYKQLIHEAETILVSMKTTAIRDTPVPSPSRRICNVPPNKRVEMLRNCEADLRRELSKLQKPNIDVDVVVSKKEINEIIPTSPVRAAYANGNGGRFSPRKTHLTNFISQNATPAELLRRQSIPESPPPSPLPSPAPENYEMKLKRSPRLQLSNGNRMKMTPPKSPTPRRRFRSQSPRVCIEESDSENDAINANGVNAFAKKSLAPKRSEINGNKENKLRHSWRKIRQPPVVKEDILNQNTIPAYGNDGNGIDNRPFRSMDMANRYPESCYCPQSEPLKRKIYSEKTLDRLQKSFDMESEIPKKALLQKISMLRRERQIQAAAAAATRSHSIDGYYAAHPTYPRYEPHQVLNGGNGGASSTNENDVASFHKRQLILNTIEDLKRNLEDQSIELCGLNDDED